MWNIKNGELNPTAILSPPFSCFFRRHTTTVFSFWRRRLQLQLLNAWGDGLLQHAADDAAQQRVHAHLNAKILLDFVGNQLVEHVKHRLQRLHNLFLEGGYDAVLQQRADAACNVSTSIVHHPDVHRLLDLHRHLGRVLASLNAGGDFLVIGEGSRVQQRLLRLLRVSSPGGDAKGRHNVLHKISHLGNGTWQFLMQFLQCIGQLAKRLSGRSHARLLCRKHQELVLALGRVLALDDARSIGVAVGVEQVKYGIVRLAHGLQHHLHHSVHHWLERLLLHRLHLVAALLCNLVKNGLFGLVDGLQELLHHRLQLAAPGL
eukprot:m.77672 g.77672  ORF g.77672 m.77672 type:complete len:318 (+) comp17306_c0_seq1:85-1038(+)